jgi:non-heme chloroperoxidase
LYASVLYPDPELEILHQPALNPVGAPPVLLIHGAYAGAWCWQRYFMPHLAQLGLEVYALSLRGHGGSGGHHYLHFNRLRDYARDVRRALDQIGAPAVLVGHSMGGLVVQKFLERHAVPGAALMASIPPSGLLQSSARLALRDPLLYQQLNLIQLGGYHLISVQALRRALFRPDTPLEQVAPYLGHLQAESLAALVDMTLTDLPVTARGTANPILVMGAGADALFSVSEVRETALAFGVEPLIFDGMPHAMMLDRDWRLPADALARWVRSLG